VIPDDEEADPVIDISWYFFISKTKLGLTSSEAGRITITLFNRLYQHYKNNFDLEMQLTQTGTTYEAAYKKAQDAQEWF